MRPIVTATTLLSLLVASFCDLRAQDPQQPPSQPPANTTAPTAPTPATDRANSATTPTVVVVPPGWTWDGQKLVKVHHSHTLRTVLIIGGVVATGITLGVVLAHHGIKCGPGLGQPGVSNAAACS